MLPQLVGDLEERPALGGAGVVDEHVYLAERAGGGLVGLAAAVRGADVGGDGDDLDVGGGGDVGLGLVERALVAGDDGDVGAGAGEVLGDGAADAEAAAGDERIAAVHAHLHVSLPAIVGGFCAFARQLAPTASASATLSCSHIPRAAAALGVCDRSQPIYHQRQCRHDKAPGRPEEQPRRCDSRKLIPPWSQAPWRSRC